MKKYICKDCGTSFNVPRKSFFRNTCPKCRNSNVINTDTPVGQELIEKYKDKNMEYEGFFEKIFTKKFFFIAFGIFIFFSIIGGLAEKENTSVNTLANNRGKIFSSSECSNIVYDYYEKSLKADLSFSDKVEISNICDVVIEMYNQDEMQLLERVNSRLKYNHNITDK